MDDFNVRSLEQMVSRVDSVMGALTLLLACIAGIALLVYAAKAKKPAAVVHPQPVRKAETHFAHGVNQST
jgi:hypothetical protein